MTRRRRFTLAATAAATLITAPVALGHELFDHAPPSFTPQVLPSAEFDEGGEGADWELLGSIPTGNPHTDLDFFTRGGNTYASVGTLGAGPNAGGQTIVQLTEGDEVKPSYASSHPSASCVVNEGSALGLQHDVEASPKGKAILNTFNPLADTRDTQIVVDATDAAGRCHDGGVFGLDRRVSPYGGLEIIDVTDPKAPKEIGLTSHVGEAHTVNIDPKRPHIAYAVTSDSVNVDSGGRRANTTGGAGLDGFEVVDMSSCMNFPEGTTVEQKRERCRPEVFRYRYPDVRMAWGHTNKGTIYGCHELEIYPNDRLTCGGGAALITLDMSGAFDDRGTPDDFTDDKPRGRPLPCQVRSSSSAEFGTGAKVVDCVDGTNAGTDDLFVSKWLQDGAPSLEGVRYLGSAFHMGREGTGETEPDFDSTQDIDFDHEAELTQSGNLLIATDERGGGVAPPGATCSQVSDNKIGNGGVHFYRANGLLQSTPEVKNAEGEIDTKKSAEAAFNSYARQPNGEKAIYRAPVRTGAQATICTAHVFQQIPGQNRIFMGWYSQGTQVLDFTEKPDGTVEFREAGHFIPASANEWVSHIFKAQENPDGTFTYWGAAADFNLGERGRNAIDVYRVTLPAPPKPADGPGVLPRGKAGIPANASTRGGAPACVATSTIKSLRARGAGRGLRVSVDATAPVTVDLFRQSVGRRVIGERLVQRKRGVRGAVRLGARDRRGRRLGNGYYVARVSTRLPTGQVDARRVALVRRGGRFKVRKAYETRASCGLIRSAKLERPVFGGRTNRALNVGFRLGDEARVSVVIRRAGRVVRRFAERSFRGGTLHRLRATVKRGTFPRGRYTVTITARAGDQTVVRRLTAQRL
jgi:hypothetical protein